MLVGYKYKTIVCLTLTISLLLSGCLQDKKSQCQKLIQVVNGGNSLIEQNKGQQVTTSSQLSRDLQAITNSLRELNLSDPNLKDIQGQYIKVFQDLSQAIAKASQALGKAKAAEASSKGREKLQKARTEIDSVLTDTAKTVGKQSDKLAVQLNKYCNEPQ